MLAQLSNYPHEDSEGPIWFKRGWKLFWEKLVNLFDDFDLKQVASNKCIFKKDLPNGKTFYVCVYVDDVIIATDDEETRLEFLKHYEKEFPGTTMNSENAFIS